MIPRHGKIILLASLLIMTAGCQYPAFVMDSFFPTYQQPLYKLAAMRTAILVDDTNQQLGDPILTGTIAERIGQDLTYHKILEKGQFVSYREIRKIQAQLGEAFEQTPINKISQKLNAPQIIHVNIDQIQLATEPGILNPQATVTVKVLDVQQGIRVFPPLSAARDIDAISASSRGYRLTVKLPRIVQLKLDPGSHRMLMRQLANEIGITVGKLFYKHLSDDI